MTKASTKKGMAGRLLAAGCSLALAASLTPAAALTALAAVGDSGELTVSVMRGDESVMSATLDLNDLIDKEKITPVKGEQSTLYFTASTTSAEDEGEWGVISSEKNSVVSLTDIFRNAKKTGANAASYWQPGTKLKVSGTVANSTATSVTLTYEQVEAATSFYPYTKQKAINTSGAVKVTPGIALKAGSDTIAKDSNAQATAGKIATKNAENALSIGLSGADYDVANLAKNVTGVKKLTIELPAQEYADVPRIYGEDWSDTMNAVVGKTGFGKGSNFVVASSNNYQDALTASGLAGTLGCPLLLTDKDELTQQTADRINGLAANGGATVYVIGGPLAVSESVKTKINQLTGIEGKKDNPVVRLAGETAAETSLAVYEKMAELTKAGTYAANMTKVVVTTSIAFQDAMSISPYTYASKIPVVLTGDGNALENGTLAALKKQTAEASALTEALVLGGKLAVADSVENQLFGNGVTTVKRIGEETCWETSNAIAKYLTKDAGFAAGSTQATVATGDNYLDALVASQYCADPNNVAGMKQVLLLVGNGQGGDYVVDNFIDDNVPGLTTVNIVGGPQAVSNVIAGKINAILN